MISQILLDEFLVLAIKDKKFRAIFVERMNEGDIPKELPAYRKAFKYISETSIEDDITLGGVHQYSRDTIRQNDVEKADKMFERLLRTELPPMAPTVSELMKYIKKVEYQLLTKKVAETYNAGFHEKAIDMSMEGVQKIIEKTTIKEHEDALAQTVFERALPLIEENIDRATRNELVGGKKKGAITGIPALDKNCGRLEAGSLFGWVAPTGVGKSTVLRWSALANALDGQDTVFISLEGNKDEVINQFSAMIAGVSYRDIKDGSISEDQFNKLKKALAAFVSAGKKLHVQELVDYESATIGDMKGLTDEYIDKFGKYPDIIMVDYIDLLLTGNAKYDNDPNSKKAKLQKIAEFMKNWAKVIDGTVMTAAQTKYIDTKDSNNMNFVITKDMCEGDKTLAKPFTHMVSINISDMEAEFNQCRLYWAKIRHSKGRMVVHICTDFGRGRFYSPKEPVDIVDKAMEKSDEARKKKKEKAKENI